MGDRSNIVVKQPDGSSIWLYGHWLGEGAIEVVGNVLSRKVRWSDHAYLTRMLFDEMTEGSLDKETGFGISTAMQDNEYPIIVLNPATQKAWVEEYSWTDGSLDVITPLVDFKDMANACSFSRSFSELATALGARIVAA